MKKEPKEKIIEKYGWVVKTNPEQNQQ